MVNNILNESKIREYYDAKNVLYNDRDIEVIHNNLNNKNNKIYDSFKNIFNRIRNFNLSGGAETVMPSEFFGKNSGSFVESSSKPPTITSDYDAISESTRPEILSDEFPLMNGGCGCAMLGGGKNRCKSKKLKGETINKNICSGCKKKYCIRHPKKGGCPMCKNMFTKKDVENVSKLLETKINKKDYDIVAASLTLKFKEELNNNISKKSKKIKKLKKTKQLKKQKN
jgi:hypothetical protein